MTYIHKSVTQNIETLAWDTIRIQVNSYAIEKVYVALTGIGMGSIRHVLQEHLLQLIRQNP
jgi:hypothetical protein